MFSAPLAGRFPLPSATQAFIDLKILLFAEQKI
jgi:hypothetical protein